MIARVVRTELRKLSHQLGPRLLVLLSAVAPFAFAGLLRLQNGTPADTLFGVHVHDSGSATSLVVLGFGATWAFPIIAGVLAGDLFSAEDRYATWKTLLTRSPDRDALFAGKVLAAGVAATAVLLIIAVASVVAGAVFTGHMSVVGLTGTQIDGGSAVARVLLSWLVCLPPLLAFTAVAVLLSVVTRNGIAGVIGPSLVNLVMQLLALVGSGVWVNALLVASGFHAWHGFFASPSFLTPLVIALVVSALWIAGCLAAARTLLARRDFTADVPRARPATRPALRLAAAFAAVVIVLALGQGVGPKAVTVARVQADVAQTFDNLVALQQARSGAARVALTTRAACQRRSAQADGPGDWTCRMEISAPALGATAIPPTLTTYDLTVQSNGCYKADAPPTRGSVTVLATFYGCFDWT